MEGSTLTWIDHIVGDFDSEVVLSARGLGFSQELASNFVGESRVMYQDLDIEMGLKVPSIQVKEIQVLDYPLLVLFKKNLILTIHPLSVDHRFTRLRRYAETILRKIPLDMAPQDRLTVLLIRIIDHNNSSNFDHLQQIEYTGSKLFENVTNPSTPRLKSTSDIYRMKQALSNYLNGLWNTVDVLHTLHYGDAELISDDPKLLGKIGVLVDDVNEQIGLAEHMTDVLVSGSQVLQNIYNNQLLEFNNRLIYLTAYLTVAGTAILVPNTLATIMANSAFNLGSKDIGWYLVFLIFCTIGATLFVYLWLKRKGWILPKKFLE